MNFWAKAVGKKAELFIYDSIGQDFFGEGITAKSVADALAEFKPNADIDIFINSPGGSVFDGVAIYNQLARWGGRKVVHIDGIAASIASVIAMVGDEIKIAENGIMMIHSAWGLTVGNAEEMRKYADSLEKIDGTILSTYVSRTKGKEDEIANWMKAETWMNADECVSRGFATSKTGDKGMKAEFEMLGKFKNTPQTLKSKRDNNTELAVNRMVMRMQQLNRRETGATA